MTQRNVKIDRRRDSRDSQRDSVRAIDSGTHSRATDRAADPERQTGKSDRNLRLHVVSHMRRSECVLDGAHGTTKSKPAGIKLGMLTSLREAGIFKLVEQGGAASRSLCDSGKRHPSTYTWLKTRERGEDDDDIRYG